MRRRAPHETLPSYQWVRPSCTVAGHRPSSSARAKLPSRALDEDAPYGCEYGGLRSGEGAKVVRDRFIRCHCDGWARSGQRQHPAVVDCVGCGWHGSFRAGLIAIRLCLPVPDVPCALRAGRGARRHRAGALGPADRRLGRGSTWRPLAGTWRPPSRGPHCRRAFDDGRADLGTPQPSPTRASSARSSAPSCRRARSRAVPTSATEATGSRTSK